MGVRFRMSSDMWVLDRHCVDSNGWLSLVIVGSVRLVFLASGGVVVVAVVG